MSSTRTSRQREPEAKPRVRRAREPAPAPAKTRTRRTAEPVAWDTLPEVVSYLDHVSQITVDYSKYVAELTRLHHRRKSRALSEDRGRVRSDKLLAVSAQEASNRSRVIAIRMECQRVTTRIENLRKATIVTLVESSRGESLIGSSKTAKTELLSVNLDSRTPVLFDLYDVLDTCDYILEDMKQTGFSLARIVHIYELSTRPDLT